MGYLYTVKPRVIPESHHAILSIFGNSYSNISRGELEARGAGLDVKHGDLVFRTNFATTDNFEDLNIVDSRAGRTLTTAEAIALAKSINSEVKLKHIFQFHVTSQHRGVLIFKGGFSDNISSTDLRYDNRKLIIDHFVLSKPLDDNEDSQYSADLINQFSKQAFDVLDDHYINEKRRKKGLMPANFIACRGAGNDVPNLRKYKKWAMLAYMPLEIGFADLSGMGVYKFTYPKLKNYDVYANLEDGLKMAIKQAIRSIKKAKKKYDYFYVHFKETDLPGHDNKPFVKKEMVELIDKKFFSFVKDFATKNNIKVIVTADHSTPCNLKDHSADPVPVLFFNHTLPRKQEFNEKTARRGSLGRMVGNEVLTKTGFVRR